VRDLKGGNLPIHHTNKHLHLSSAYLTRSERPFKLMLVESMASLKPSDLGKREGRRGGEAVSVGGCLKEWRITRERCKCPNTYLQYALAEFDDTSDND
jgi:hypothetical protein